MEKWIFDPEKPLFRQICEKLCDDIARGVYAPGQRIPSVRDFAIYIGVNPNTVQRALSELENDGILVSKRGDGRYVADDGTLRDMLLGERIKSACEDFIGAMRDIGLDDGQIVEALEKRLHAETANE